MREESGKGKWGKEPEELTYSAKREQSLCCVYKQCKPNVVKSFGLVWVMQTQTLHLTVYTHDPARKNLQLPQGDPKYA